MKAALSLRGKRRRRGGGAALLSVQRCNNGGTNAIITGTLSRGKVTQSHYDSEQWRRRRRRRRRHPYFIDQPFPSSESQKSVEIRDCLFEATLAFFFSAPRHKAILATNGTLSRYEAGPAKYARNFSFNLAQLAACSRRGNVAIDLFELPGGRRIASPISG